MSPDREFRLGIIGGCLAWQPGTPACLLYQNVLAGSLRQTTGAVLLPQVARFSDGEYVERLLELASESRLDGVVLFIRILLLRKTGILVKHRASGVTTYAVHPFLLRRGQDRRWDDLERSAFQGYLRYQRGGPARVLPPEPDGEAPCAPNMVPAPEILPPPDMPQDHYDTRPRLNQLPGISFGRVSRFAGRLLGLEDWAVEDEIREMTLVHEACCEMGIPLAVFGPFPAPYAVWIERFMSRVRDRVRLAAATLGASYVDISTDRKAADMEFIMADGIHMNEEGHRLVAAALHDPVAGWIGARRARESAAQEAD